MNPVSNPTEVDSTQEGSVGAPTNGNNQVVTDAQSAAPQRVAATEADYLAVQLHQARAAAIELRKALITKEATVAEQQLTIGRLRQQLIQMEIAAEEKENTSLRKTFKLEMGKTIHRDEATGSVWWESTPAQ